MFNINAHQHCTFKAILMRCTRIVPVKESFVLYAALRDAHCPLGDEICIAPLKERKAVRSPILSELSKTFLRSVVVDSLDGEISKILSVDGLQYPKCSLRESYEGLKDPVTTPAGNPAFFLLLEHNFSLLMPL